MIENIFKPLYTEITGLSNKQLVFLLAELIFGITLPVFTIFAAINTFSTIRKKRARYFGGVFCICCIFIILLFITTLCPLYTWYIGLSLATGLLFGLIFYKEACYKFFASINIVAKIYSFIGRNYLKGLKKDTAEGIEAITVIQKNHHRKGRKNDE